MIIRTTFIEPPVCECRYRKRQIRQLTAKSIDLKLLLSILNLPRNDEISSGMGCTSMRPAAGTNTMLKLPSNGPAYLEPADDSGGERRELKCNTCQ